MDGRHRGHRPLEVAREVQLQARDVAEPSRSVLHGKNLYFILSDAVYHPVALHEGLADIFELVFWHDTTATRKHCQPISRLEDLFSQAGGLPR